MYVPILLSFPFLYFHSISCSYISTLVPIITCIFPISFAFLYFYSHSHSFLFHSHSTFLFSIPIPILVFRLSFPFLYFHSHSHSYISILIPIFSSDDMNIHIEKHCILITNLPPSSMPVFESLKFGGMTHLQVAEYMGKVCI